MITTLMEALGFLMVVEKPSKVLDNIMLGLLTVSLS